MEPTYPPAPRDAAFEDISLLEFLDLSQINCLNEESNHTLKSIVGSKSRNASGSFLLSDADEQLLLNIPFNQAVRVRSIEVQSSKSGNAPKTIKLLINRPSLGFEDVEEADEPDVAQVLELSQAEVEEGRRIPLRYVRFQSVTSLHIFVASNYGNMDETRIDILDIFGVPVEATKNLGHLKNQGN